MGDGDEERYTSAGDPNSAALNAAMDDMRPDFVKHDSSDDSGNDESRDALRSSEESASKSTGGASGDSQDDMNQAESNVQSDYANNVGKDGGKGEEKPSMGDMAKKLITRGKGGKKAGPLASLLISLVMGGCGFAGVQGVLPYSLMNIFKSNFGSIDVANNVRGDILMKGILTKATSYHTSNLSQTQHAATMSFDFSPRQRKLFERSNIQIDMGNETMTFKDATIVVDKTKADPANKVYFFDDYYTSNTDFHVAYNAATATWKKSASAYMSESIENYYYFRGISKKIVKGGIAAIKGVVSLGKMVGGKINNLKNKKPSSTTNDAGDLVASPSSDPRKITDFGTDPPEDADWSFSGTNDRQDATDEIGGKAKGVAKKLAVAGSIANVICSVFTILNAFFQLVFQDSVFRMLSTAQQIFGALQKAQAGDSKDLGDIMKNLSKDATAHYSKKQDGYGSAKMTGVSETDDDEDAIDNAQYQWEDTTKSGSALTSEGIQGLYSGNIANAYTDESASQFNLFASLEGASKHLNLAVASFRKCAFTRLATDMAAFAGDLAMVAGCLLSLGVGCILEALEDVAIEVAKGVAMLAITYAVSQLIGYMIPQLVAIYVPEVLNNLVGEDLGNMLTSAGNQIMAGAGQFTGGSVAGASAFASYEQARLQVVADNARYEREIYSPFDIRSSNTFFGSIVNSMVPVTAYVGVSISGGVKTFGNLISKSLRNLLPTANAINSTINAEQAISNTKNHCPLLDAVGAVGDPYCNPYTITDLNTMGTDPANVLQSPAIKESLNEDVSANGLTGKYTIKEDSGLAKWIKYCSRRSSPVGVTDQNIANDLGVSTGGAAASTVLSHVPIVGSGIDLLNDARMLSYAGYITGESCVTSNASGTFNSVSGVDIKAQIQYQQDRDEKEALNKKLAAFFNAFSGALGDTYDWQDDASVQNGMNTFNNHWGGYDIICTYYYCVNDEPVWGDDSDGDGNPVSPTIFEDPQCNYLDGLSDVDCKPDPNDANRRIVSGGGIHYFDEYADPTPRVVVVGTPNSAITDMSPNPGDIAKLGDIYANVQSIYNSVYDLNDSNSLQSRINAYEEKRKKDNYNFEAVISGAPTWDEARVYQRFAQDQAIMEDMGVIEKSAVTAYHEELNKTLDNSYLGIMARYTGMTKDYIVAVVDGMEVLDWIAQYDPTDFSPTPAEHVDEPDHQFDEDEYDSSTYIAYYTQTFFEDRRQRNFAA